MTSPIHDSFVDEVVSEARRIRSTAASEFLEHGLSVGELKYEQTQGPGGVSSEIRMYITRDSDIVDVIEFFVLRNGARAASTQDISDWLERTFNDVLSRRQ